MDSEPENVGVDTELKEVGVDTEIERGGVDHSGKKKWLWNIELDGSGCGSLSRKEVGVDHCSSVVWIQTAGCQ